MAANTTMQTREQFGIQLRRWREENNKTQQELAGILECSFSVIGKWERGVKFPTVLYLKRRIKEVTGIDVNDFSNST